MSKEQSLSVEDGNRLIADFLAGVKLEPYYKYHYHDDWQRLMPALKKFYLLGYSKNKSAKWSKQYEDHCDTIDNKVTLYEIMPAWSALVEAIQWYNTQSKK